MERLTQKEEYNWLDFMDEGIDVPMNKLRKLEDLEEQIGMPLDILFKLITFEINQLYVNSSNKIIKCNQIMIFGRCIIGKSSDIADKNEYMYAFSEFKKIWFLDKDEAEKKLEEMKDGI